MSALARRELLRHMVNHGLSERRSLRVIGMSASAYRYEAAQEHNYALKDKFIALVQRRRRYGAGMIYLTLRQAGELVNYKRVDRLCAEAVLPVKKRRRKKIPIADRPPRASDGSKSGLVYGLCIRPHSRGAQHQKPVGSV